LGLGLAYQKRRLQPKLAGVWLGSTQKNWDPYVFMQPLNLAISNLVHIFGLGLAYQKKMFSTKIAGVLARGASKKVGTPTYFCNR